MPAPRPPSSSLLGSALSSGSTQAFWGCFGKFVGDCLDKDKGLAAAILLIEPTFAISVISVASVVGFIRYMKGKRDHAKDEAYRNTMLELAQKGANAEIAADILLDNLRDGELMVNFDDLVKQDLDDFFARDGGAFRQVLRDEFKQVLTEYPLTPEQYECFAEDFAGYRETTEILLWTIDHRTREHSRDHREIIDLLRVIITSLETTQTHANTVGLPPENLRPRNPRFAGRVKDLRELHESLTAHTDTGITQEQGISASGGVGKTTLAVEYAWRHLSHYPGGVFFIDPRQGPAISQLAQLAPYLGIEPHEKETDTAAAVKHHLESGGAPGSNGQVAHSLLILDNITQKDHWNRPGWRDLLPAKCCRRIFTTRSESLGDIDMKRLNRLTAEEGLDILANFREDAAAPENERIVKAIVNWLGGLAVGVVTIGAYMKTVPDATWPGLADHLTQKGLGDVEQHLDEVHEGGPLVGDYENRVNAVIADAFAALPAPEQRALEYAALLPWASIYRPWLISLLESEEEIELTSPPGVDRSPAAGAINHLESLGWLETADEEQENLLVLHAVRGEWLTPGEGKNRLLDAICTLAKQRGQLSRQSYGGEKLTGTEEQKRTQMLALREELAPLAALIGTLEEHDRFEQAVLLANWIGGSLRQLGRLVEARGVLEPFAAADDLQERVGHQMNASCYSNLALILQALGDLPGARQHMERAIAIEEKHFDPDHPTLAISYSNLAMILKDLGDLPAARQHMERAIAIDEKHFDHDHPTLATSYSNLAMILQDLGDLPAAREHMERAIEIDEKHFDPDHPTFATKYNNLAWIEHAEGNTARACELWRRTLSIFLKHFDANHPHVQIVKRILAHHCGG